MASWGVESKVKSFLQFAINKLDSCAESLQDEDPEDNFQELTAFTTGLSRHLKNTAAPASQELKNTIIETLQPAWDVRTDKPGDDLSVASLRAALEALLGAISDEEPAEEEEDEDTKPDGLEGMSLQDAISYMWKLDEPNRVNWGDSGFTLNMQQKGRYGQDRCDDVLFDWVNLEHPFWSHPVTKAYISLLDNYERETGKEERATAEEKQEMAQFLDALCRTKVIKFVFAYLKANGGADARCGGIKSLLDFQNIISDLWMAPYRRFKKNDSSGFEHVFVGEEKRGKIIGLHNWVQFYLEEKKGNIDYLGWSGKQDSDYSDDVNLVTVKFAWNDDDAEEEVKPMSTMLCGSTVEFEMAILTLVFLAGNQDGENVFQLGSEKIKVKCYPQNVRYGGAKVGTAYLEIA